LTLFAARCANARVSLAVSNRFRAGILDGRLRPGLCLPATRDLARQYGLSRGTVVNAFDQAQVRRLLGRGNMGSGNLCQQNLARRVAAGLRRSQIAARAQSVGRQAKAARFELRPRDCATFSNFQLRPSRAFRANLPALDLFPTTLWAQDHRQAPLRRASMNLLLGCDSMGYRPLREAVANYLVTSHAE